MNKHNMRNNKNCYMSRVLVLKCEHMAEVMEISDLTASSSASVEGMFLGAVSPIKTSVGTVWDFPCSCVNFRERNYVSYHG